MPWVGLTTANKQPRRSRYSIRKQMNSLYLVAHRTTMVLASAFVVLVTMAVPAARGQDDLGRRTENTVFRDSVDPQWQADGQSFWYRVKTGRGSHEFVFVHAATGEVQRAATFEALTLPEPEPLRTSASQLESRPSRRTGVSSGLRFVNTLDTEIETFWIDPSGKAISYGRVAANGEREQHTFDGHVWMLATLTGERLGVIEARASITKVLIDAAAREPDEKPRRRPGRGPTSPDGQWSVQVESDHVQLTNKNTQETRTLRVQLGEGERLRGSASWSPSSKAFVLSAAAEVSQRRVSIVESTPENQLQPTIKEFNYVKPGDPLPNPRLVLFRISEDEGLLIDDALFAQPFTLSHDISVNWSPTKDECYFSYNERGHQCYRILALNAETGAVRVVVEETSKTFIDYNQKTWREFLHESGELLWMSERDGWCHLYRYDLESGSLKNRLTEGAWPVREVLHVDAENRQVWFMASGLRADEDPYHKHLCRVNFDGSEFVRLTEGDGNHSIEFSPNRAWFVDRWSRADHPPVHELRRSDDGSLVAELERADVAALLAAGWTMPERFVAKGRDGKTDIHGVIIKPSDFDPTKSYPVVEEIYAGPHSAFAPKEFSRWPLMRKIAEAGFIVVKLDGQGTNHRGKAFHDVAWKNLKDSGFPDRIEWIRAAAKTRPWMDLSRVGIYGGSAGGQSAMRAVLDHHDFYKVAVADCGCHDNRMDKIWWNEQWMGWPVDESYAASSNAEDAEKLGGELLLIVGELDTNVDPASTMQVVAALQKAGKSFEFMPIVGAGHGAAETPYGSRLRLDFLKRHLLPDASGE
jgi:dipeptidyl aminopeptidase/acylaminoacyl peptidase